MYVPLPIDDITLGEPLPVNVWDPQGQLLLRKGHTIRDERHRQWLLMHNPQVKEDEYRAWTYRYTTAIDRALRGNQSLEAIAGVTRPMGFDDAVEVEPDARPIDEIWADLHAVLTLLLHQGDQAQDFVGRFLRLEQRMQVLLRSRIDDSLFVLVQMLFDRGMGYSASHALLCAVVGRLVAQTLGWDEARQQSLQRAALTMNLGMGRLHDDLARQDAALHPEQRRAVWEHPLCGEASLRRLGVVDAVWLELVRDHHEQAGGAGYPRGRAEVGAAAQLLRMIDVYVARISPRMPARVCRPRVPCAMSAWMQAGRRRRSGHPSSRRWACTCRAPSSNWSMARWASSPAAAGARIPRWCWPSSRATACRGVSHRCVTPANPPTRFAAPWCRTK
ncbi:HD-GYP domain-containing protein [Tepidimonas sp.]|uniref:HD-GYP domain-containing protein n=1 Tax=Tepidimonas sp. TaxID=2002775 RepID=UPI002FE24C2F